MDFFETMFCAHNESIEELIKNKKIKGETRITLDEAATYDLLPPEIEEIERELTYSG